jgi:hypothetical protein
MARRLGRQLVGFAVRPAVLGDDGARITEELAEPVNLTFPGWLPISSAWSEG